MTVSMQATPIRTGLFLITPNDANNLPTTAVGLVIGNTAGNVRILTDDGDDVTVAVGAHQFLQVQVNRVFATGTTATAIYGYR